MDHLLTTLATFDQMVFIAINTGINSAFMDLAMPLITTFRNWIPVFAGVVLWLIIKGGPRGRWCALALVIVVSLTDLLCNRAIKPWVERPRPCHELSGVIVRIPCPEGPSFPSSHALNMAAVAVVFSRFYRRWSIVWWVAAGVVGFSRVYVGVHYPIDVLAGWLMGAISALGFLWCAEKSAAFMRKRRLQWW
ncbi:MAG: phosphatase PAP2 family protein [Chlorobi bacterium]|nr:phosphatase PAP2 family protein [Chlorobiota bacterium]